MTDHGKILGLTAGALLCLGGAGVLLHSFGGSWISSGPTTVAGPMPAIDVKSSDILQKHYAYITGAVKRPGVYAIPGNARVFHLVEAAGGLTENADHSAVNLAAVVKDSEHVHILSLGTQRNRTETTGK